MSLLGLRFLAAALLLGAALFGVHAWQAHLVGLGDVQGAARVQAAWDAQENDRNAATAQDNATKFRNAERVTHEDAQREAARLARDAAAATAVRSLRAEVARLNSRADPYAATDAGLAACAGEAATARELFEESAAAYSELAATADQLGDQVSGLQDFAHSVCHAPQAAQGDNNDDF